MTSIHVCTHRCAPLTVLHVGDVSVLSLSVCVCVLTIYPPSVCDSVLSPVQSSATCEDCTVAWGVCNHGMHAMHAYVSLRASHPAPESFPRRSLADALRRLYNAFTDASMWAMCMLYVLSPSCAAFHFHCISRWLKTRQVCPLGTIYIGHCTHTSHACISYITCDSVHQSPCRLPA